jgi:CRISPR/Cas system-associated exonuclease Cas4 (RecB family)
MSKLYYLSYSTINNLYKSPHSYINKSLGLKVPENEAMRRGKEAHEVFSNHVCGLKKDPRVKVNLDFQYPERKIFIPYRAEYGLYAQLDACSYKAKSFCEYKTSTHPWGQAKFDTLMQIPLYSLASHLKHAFMVTSTADFTDWKTFYKEITDDDIKKVTKWIDDAIEIIEHGDLKADLINGHCPGNCPYGENCRFL